MLYEEKNNSCGPHVTKTLQKIYYEYICSKNETPRKTKRKISRMKYKKTKLEFFQETRFILCNC